MFRLTPTEIAKESRGDMRAEAAAEAWLSAREIILPTSGALAEAGFSASGWREDRATARRDYIADAALSDDGGSFKETYRSGAVLEAPTVDRGVHPGENRRLARWTVRWPSGAVLSKDEHGIIEFTAPSRRRGWWLSGGRRIRWGRPAREAANFGPPPAAPAPASRVVDVPGADECPRRAALQNLLQAAFFENRNR